MSGTRSARWWRNPADFRAESVGLKIRVSVVRFRPWAPTLSRTWPRFAFARAARGRSAPKGRRTVRSHCPAFGYAREVQRMDAPWRGNRTRASRRSEEHRRRNGGAVAAAAEIGAQQAAADQPSAALGFARIARASRSSSTAPAKTAIDDLDPVDRRIIPGISPSGVISSHQVPKPPMPMPVGKLCHPEEAACHVQSLSPCY
jgi:hypothetical protein